MKELFIYISQTVRLFIYFFIPLLYTLAICLSPDLMIVCFCWFTESPFLCFKFSCRTILNGSQNLSSSVHSFVVLPWLLASIWSCSWRCLNTRCYFELFWSCSHVCFLPLLSSSLPDVRQPLCQTTTGSVYDENFLFLFVSFFCSAPSFVPLHCPRYVTASLGPSCCVCFVFVSRGEHYMWTNVVHIVQNYVIDIRIVCLVFNIECLLPKAIINYRHSKIMILYYINKSYQDYNIFISCSYAILASFYFLVSITKLCMFVNFLPVLLRIFWSPTTENKVRCRGIKSSLRTISGFLPSPSPLR